MTTALLFSGLGTDERAWAAVAHRLASVGVIAEVVGWPTRASADPVALAEAALASGASYDVVVALGSAAPSAVRVARMGGARSVVLVGPCGGFSVMDEVGGDLDANPLVDAFFEAIGQAVVALQGGDRAGFARWVTNAVVGVIGPAHRAVIEAMTLDNIEGLTTPLEDCAWPDWLPHLAVPLVMVFGLRASEDGSYASRAADVLLHGVVRGSVLPWGSSLPSSPASPTPMNWPTSLLTQRRRPARGRPKACPQAKSIQQMEEAAPDTDLEVSGPVAPDVNVAVTIVQAYLSERHDHDHDHAMREAREVAWPPRRH